MRVLMTADTVGGVWTYALDLASALAPRGVEVALATMGAPLSSSQWAQASTRDNLTIYESTFKLEWMDEPWRDVQCAGDWLLQLQEEVRPDAIHLNGYAHGALPWKAPVLMAGHSCVPSWWRAVKGEAAPPQWNHYREEVEVGLRAADLVVAPTQAMLDELHHFYGPLPPSRVIFNGCDAARFRRGTKEPFVFAAGRLWDEAKNIAALDTVAPQLAWSTFVAGDSCRPDGGESCRANVQLLGKLEEEALTRRMASASIYALPARYEPFGLSILEAALCGCALVLGDIPSLREVWGDAALYVSPDDVAALQRVLADLIADEARRTDYSERASQRAQRYSCAAMGRSYFEAYRELTAAVSRRGLACQARVEGHASGVPLHVASTRRY